MRLFAIGTAILVITALFVFSLRASGSSDPFVAQGTLAPAAGRTSTNGPGILLIPDAANDRVMAFDAETGDLLDENLIPPDPTHLATPKNALVNAAGDRLYVSDAVNDVVQAYDLDGNYVGVFAPAGGPDPAILDNVHGIAWRPNGNLLATVNLGANRDAVAEFDPAGVYLGNFIARSAGGLDDPAYLFLRAADWLVSGTASDAIHRFDLNGSYLANLVSINSFPQQITEAANGNILVANFSGTEEGILEYTAEGVFVGRYDPGTLTSYRGVYELPNGNILATTNTGVHEIDRSGNWVESKILGPTGQFIEFVPVSMSLVKTVGLDPHSCATTAVITADVGDPVTYCYRMENTGSTVFDGHNLVDSRLGMILSDYTYSLSPGASFFVTRTAVFTGSVINQATWSTSRTITSTLAVDAATVIVAGPAAPLTCNGPAVNFNAGFPADWTTMDNSGRGLVWADLAACQEGNYTGGSGGAACSSSDNFGEGDFDAELQSPILDLSGYTSATLRFQANYQNYVGLDVLDVDVSTNGGNTWATLLHWNEDHGAFRALPGEAVAVNLSAYVGQSNLRLRWRYYDPNEGDDWDWYAQVDDVYLSCSTEPQPDVQVDPTALSSTQPPNTQVGQTLTISNLGGALLVWNIEEGPAGQVAGDGWQVVRSGHFSAFFGDKSPTTNGWQVAGERPVVLALNRLSPSPLGQSPNPLIPANPDTDVSLVLDDGGRENAVGLETGGQFVWFNQFTPDPALFPIALDEIQVLFGADTGVNIGELVDLYVYEDADGDPNTGATFVAAAQDVAVQAADDVTWSVYSLNPAATLNGPGDVLLAVVNRTAGTDAGEYPAALDESPSQGRSWAGSYLSGNPGDPPTFPADDLWGLIDDFGLPGNWLIRGYGSSGCGSIDFPWVSVVPASGTTASGDSSSVQVTFDSTGLTNGTYEGTLCLNSNDPGAPLLAIPLTLVVAQSSAPTPTPTPAYTPTATATPTRTPTAAPSHTPTSTASPTPSATPSPTATATATPTSSPTATAAPTITPSATPTCTPTATVTPPLSPTPPADESFYVYLPTIRRR